MKILKIRLRNMHSLKGDHSIDFTSSPLSDAGLFVITGPTGAGKSTILDAITLALYNRIPRIKSKSITTKDIEDEGIIITKNTKDCFAEVEYEVKGSKYLSSWSISRNRNNKLNDRKQELIDLETGNILISGKNEVVSENEKIIGLTYEQFVQSLVLAQGQFAKLLLAKKDDRNKLLEDITGGAIYRTIGTDVFIRYSRSKKVVEEQKIRMGEIVLYSDEKIAEVQKEIEANKPTLSALDLQSKSLDEKIRIKKEITSNTLELEKLTQAILHFSNRKQALAPDIIKLEEHTKFIVFKERLNTLETKRILISDISKKKELISSQIFDKTKEKENLIQEGKTLTSKELNEINFVTELEQFFKLASSLIEKELGQTQLLDQESNKIKDKIKDLLKYKYILPSDEKLQDELNELVDLIEKEITKKGLESIEKIRERKDKLNKSILPATKLIGDAKLFQERENGLQGERKRHLEKIEILKESGIKQKDFTLTKDQLQAILSQKKIQLDDFNTRKGLDEHRKELEKDKPCPLCGSLEHPFVSAYDDSQFNALQLEYNRLLENFEEIKIALSKTEVTIDRLQKEIEIEKNELHQKTKAQETLSAQLNVLCQELNWERNIDLKVWDENLIEMQKEQATLDDLERKLQDLFILKDLQILAENKKQLEIKTQKAISDRKKVYQGSDLNGDVNKLSQKFTLLQAELKSKQQTFIEQENTIKENETECDSIGRLLLSELKTLGVNSTDELKMKLLEELKAEEIRKLVQESRDEEIKLSTNKTLIEKNLSEAIKLDDTTITLLELISSKNELEISKEQIQKTILELEIALKNDDGFREKNKNAHAALQLLQKDLDLWTKMNLLIGDATGKKFSNFVQDLTLEQLIHYGNKRLISFSDRYLLDTPKPTESEALKVIDTFMGNTRRAVSSLSGGETFKLSLALAFGLSDLAAKNVEIESLFIDEGFGSLDPESLDQSISILEKMQNEGNKSIGIISHVGELKDRIATKIKLIQTGSGYSRIEVE